jgi:hypothetical protein
MQDRRTPEPNGVARAFWDEVRAGVVPEPDGGDRQQRRRVRVREPKLRRHASARRR